MGLDSYGSESRRARIPRVQYRPSNRSAWPVGMDTKARWPRGKRGSRSKYEHLLEEDPTLRAWHADMVNR